MRINKQKLNELLARWIRWDAELWAQLRKIQIKLLYERIIKEHSFTQMAANHEVPVQQLRQMFAVILNIIELRVSEKMASILHEINGALEAEHNGDQPREGFEFNRVNLN